MSSFRYVIGDNKLKVEEQAKEPVRRGRLDCARLYEFLYGQRASGGHVLATQTALNISSPELTLLQQELLAAEFGEEETTIEHSPRAAREIFADEGVKELEAALEIIRGHIGL